MSTRSIALLGSTTASLGSRASFCCRGRCSPLHRANRLIQYCQNTRDFMVPSLWGQVRSNSASTPCASASSVQPNKANHTLRRSTSAKIHMHHNNQTAAVLSCEKLIPLNRPGVLTVLHRFSSSPSRYHLCSGSIHLVLSCSFPHSDRLTGNGTWVAWCETSSMSWTL